MLPVFIVFALKRTIFGLRTKTIKVLNDIFSVDFCEYCATIATTKRQKISEQENGEKVSTYFLMRKTRADFLPDFNETV